MNQRSQSHLFQNKKKEEKNQHWDHADAFEASSLIFVTKQTNEQTDKGKQKKNNNNNKANKKPAEQNSIYVVATCCFGEIDIS